MSLTVSTGKFWAAGVWDGSFRDNLDAVLLNFCGTCETMEFPYSNPLSVRGNTNQRPNIKPKASEGFGRGSEGVWRDYGGVNVGGSSAVRRAFDPVSTGPSRVSSVTNYGQPNPTGTAAGVDSDGMLSLDDILNDLHKKVVSVDVNAFEVKGQPGNPLGFRSGKPAEAYGGIGGKRIGEHKVEAAGSLGGSEGYGFEPKSKEGYNVEFNASHRRGEQWNAEIVGSLGRNDQLKGQASGLREETQVVGVPQRKEEPKYGVADLLDRNAQQMGEGTSSLEMNNQSEGGVAESAERFEKGEGAAPHVVGDQSKGEVAGSQYPSEARNPHVQGEVFKNTFAGPVVVGEQYNGEDAGPQAGEQHEGEAAGLHGTSEQQRGEDAVVNGTIEQYKGEAAGTAQIHDQNQESGKLLVQEQREKALEKAIEPVFRTPDGRGAKSRRHTEIIQSPDWLPKGWFTELKTRGGGSSAGTKDKYYYDPVTQRRFRSKVEVLSYLETGMIGRYRPKVKSDGQVGRKRKTSAAFYQYAASFDNSFRPTKVRWVLNDTDGTWIPFVNGENMADFNTNEGERLFDLNRNGADACKE